MLIENFSFCLKEELQNLSVGEKKLQTMEKLDMYWNLVLENFHSVLYGEFVIFFLCLQSDTYMPIAENVYMKVWKGE